MTLEIVTTREAGKNLSKLPNTDRERVERRIEAYAAAPDAPDTTWCRWSGRTDCTGFAPATGA